MALFHVQIDTGTDRAPDPRYVPDLNEFDLMQRVIAPYCYGQAVVADHVTVDALAVTSLRVFRSERPYAVLKNKFEARARADGAALLRLAKAALDGSPITAYDDIAEVTTSYVPALKAQERRTLRAQAADTVVNQRVFVVHGRNEEIRRCMWSLLIGAGLQPIAWEDAVRATGCGSPYILDVIRAGFDEAQAVLILMTPDEHVSLLERHRRPRDAPYQVEGFQPRPNVLIEAGMALAQYPKRTVIVSVGDMREISDILGVHLVHLDGSADSREALLNRLKTAGASPYREWPAWRHVGDFDID